MGTLSIEGGKVLLPSMKLECTDILIDVKKGVILEIGNALQGDREINVSGKLVIPGLVNSHTHLAMTLLRGYSDDKPLEKWLEEDIWPIESYLSPADVYKGSQLALVELIKSGTTSFCDMYFHMSKVAEATKLSGLRAVLGQGVITVDKKIESAHEDAEEGLSFAKKFNRSISDKIKTAFMPHSITTVGKEYFEEYIPRSRELGIPIHLHANETLRDVEDSVSKYGKRPIEFAVENGILESGDFAAHCVHVDSNEIGLLAKNDIGVIHCPASNMKLASGIAPVQELLDSGVRVGLGTDGAASNNDLDLFGEMRDAAMVGKLATGNASSVNATSVVSMATSEGSKILGFPGGEIKVGQNADIAVLDLESAHLTPIRGGTSLLVYSANGSDVVHTICGGEILMRDRKIMTLNESKIIKNAQECSDGLVEKIEKNI